MQLTNKNIVGMHMYLCKQSPIIVSIIVTHGTIIIIFVMMKFIVFILVDRQCENCKYYLTAIMLYVYMHGY